MSESFEGSVPELASTADLCAALEKASDYRGDITIRLKNGSIVEGFIFDRRTGATLADSYVRLFPKGSDEKLAVSYADIAGLAFTGRDTAAGKSWAAWVKKYVERKAAGERGIELTPESLD